MGKIFLSSSISGSKLWKTHFFFLTKTFINNTRLKVGKNQVKARQHPEAEFSLCENYSLSLSMLSSKDVRRYSEKCTKNNCICFNDVIEVMTMKTRLKMKNESQRYNINRPRPRHVPK